MISMKRILLIFVFFAFFLESLPQESGREADIKAVLIYNFTKFLKWPEESEIDTFVIGVVGNTNIAEALQKITDRKTLRGKPAVVRKVENMGNTENINILYVSPDSEISIADISDKLSDRAVLIISSEEGACQDGAFINFIKKEGKIKFEINVKKLEEAGIISKSNFLNLAYQLYQ